MDKMSKALDEKYARIPALLQKAELHQQMASTLDSDTHDTGFIAEQVRHHNECADQLKKEAVEVLNEMVDDFMLLDDVDILSVMQMRYMDRLSWDSIAEKMNFSQDWVQRLRIKGLQKIASKKRRP